MRVLVIGARGFLGRHVRDRAAAAGLDVITAGRSPLPGSAAHCRLDLAAGHPAEQASMLDGVLAGQAPDVVVNCAGATAGDVATLTAANVDAVAALVTAMRRAGRAIRLVHLGSAAEYGPSRPGTAVTETTPARPGGPYGAAKLAATRLVELGRATGLDAVVLRVFNPVGPGAPATILPGRVVAELRRACAAGAAGAGVRLGPLDAVRDYIDARDVADAAVAAAVAPDLPAAVLNVGSGTAVGVRTLVAELVRISGYDGPVTEGPVTGQGAADAGRGRSGPASWQQADISAARRDLGWAPRRGLPAALSDMWADSSGPREGRFLRQEDTYASRTG